MTDKTDVSLGTISEGTLHAEDLLESFLHTLEECMKKHTWYGMTDQEEAFKGYKNLIEKAENLLPIGDDNEPGLDTAHELINELMEALSDFAPCYTYFGALEGDGADFGFWPDIYYVEDMVRDGTILKVSGLEDVPDGYCGDVMIVNDHGNVSLVYYDEETEDVTSYWSVV